MNKTGQLKHGLKIGDTVHSEFEIRELTTADMFAAEQVATSDKGLSYSGALLCQQLLRIGSFEGPFSLAIIGKLKPVDFGRLREAQLVLDAEGESEQPG